MPTLRAVISAQSINEVIKRHNLQADRDGYVHLTEQMLWKAKAIDDAQKRNPSKKLVEEMRKDVEGDKGTPRRHRR